MVILAELVPLVGPLPPSHGDILLSPPGDIPLSSLCIFYTSDMHLYLELTMVRIFVAGVIFVLLQKLICFSLIQSLTDIDIDQIIFLT